MSRPFCSHVAMLQDGTSLGAYFVNKLALPLVDFKMNVIKLKLHFVSCKDQIALHSVQLSLFILSRTPILISFHNLSIFEYF